MKKLTPFLSFCIFLAIFLSSNNSLFGQEPQPIAPPLSPDFSNRVITTDCCPKYKKTLDSIMNNAPFVLEGRVIKQIYGNLYNSYLFEIEKVYRGGERLQAGTVELVAKIPRNSMEEPPLPVFSPRWYTLFAKEIDESGVFDANNSIKLEIFNNDEFGNISVFGEALENIYSKGEVLERRLSHYAGLALSFKTKTEVRDFLANYGLYPQDVSKTDTLKVLTIKDIEKIKEKALQEAEKVENNKKAYERLLKRKWASESTLKKQEIETNIEEAMKEYEKASEIERRALFINEFEESVKQRQYPNKNTKSDEP
jgi:hypothetical protein